MDFRKSRRENILPYSQASDTPAKLEKVRNIREAFIFTNKDVEGGTLVPCNTINKIGFSTINNVRNYWDRPGMSPITNISQPYNSTAPNYLLKLPIVFTK